MVVRQRSPKCADREALAVPPVPSADIDAKLATRGPGRRSDGHCVAISERAGSRHGSAPSERWK